MRFFTFLSCIKRIGYFLFYVISVKALAVDVPIYDFPINHYAQNVNSYLPETALDYKKPLLTKEYQQKQLQAYYQHTYQSDEKGLSPWSSAYVLEILLTLKEKQLSLIASFDNDDKDEFNRHYGENFKAHDSHWLNQLTRNMNLSALDSFSFNAKNRAIVTRNTFARALPDNAPDFYHFTKAGEGFPFDNLQESSLWLGTPIYVVHTTLDKRWSLVITPDEYFAWVNNEDIALVSNDFIDKWQQAAKKGLIAITKTEASIFNVDGSFATTAYIGMVFPTGGQSANEILMPEKKQHYAIIGRSTVAENAAQKMPIRATKENFSALLKELIARPYGWGGAFFYNDCSQELKNLFAPFGLWLPRNSSKQGDKGEVLDLSHLSADKRIQALKENGKPLLTLIYLKGHIMLYVGLKAQNGVNDTPITYQNIWGLAPPSRDRRYVIGQAVFLPLLSTYPEAPDALSLADKSIFKLIYLDKLP